MNTSQTEAHLLIAETILEQLGGARRLGVMIGAHSFIGGPRSVTYSSMGGAGTLTFKFKAKAKNSANCVRISRNSSNTYTVEFIRLNGPNFWAKGDFSDVWAEDLRKLFERETGLALSLLQKRKIRSHDNHH
jgi:hypothetical protein